MKSYRWIVLILFMLPAAISQMLWLNFAPLLTQIQKKYHVDELTSNLLILVFPLVYVLISVPAGYLTDRRGYKYSITLGSVVMALFAAARIYEGPFWFLVACQVGIAIGQPFIINAISKLVADWFPPEQNALATGLGTLGMFIGMALGMALAVPLDQGLAFRGSMAVFAAMACASALLFAFFARENRGIKDDATAAMGRDLKLLVRSGNLKLLFIVSFLALGFFNGFTGWLEQILAPNGVGAEAAGNAGAAMIGGGILGAAIIPAISDWAKRRKPFLITCCIIAGALTWPLCRSADGPLLYAMSGLMGFFFLPGYALLLSSTEEFAGREKAGSATGLLMLFGNAGGVVVGIAMDTVKTSPKDWTNAVYLLLATIAASLVLALFLGESFHAREHA
ncbi:MAG: MFS transporter [Turneriella sp.]|nr:MFS transporter [Turneriella sp.]